MLSYNISLCCFSVGFTMLGGHFPVWVLTLILGIVLAALVFFTSKNEEQPKYHAVRIKVVFSQMSLCMRKPTIWVRTRSDTNQPVQSQKMVRGLQFCI